MKQATRKWFAEKRDYMETRGNLEDNSSVSTDSVKEPGTNK
jgi:hypothetical protein